MTTSVLFCRAFLALVILVGPNTQGADTWTLTGSMSVSASLFSAEIYDPDTFVIMIGPSPHGSITGIADHYLTNSTATLTATPSPGYLFTNWTGDATGTGKLPLDPLNKPALVAEARTAIEFVFPAAIGKTYRIEDSTDLVTWGTVESGIVGAGGQVQRFYSILNVPKRYFRVEGDAP